ncbi:MAG TPA: Fe-S cluster assembly protein SufB, partial [Chromatiaceae bacterium]|nr:Fe-S cluster assembly protein SufB [Chromatiaceae bacterium]
MSTQENTLDDLVKAGYEHGFVTEVESETLPPGLDEETIRFISAKKNEPQWMLEYRLKAYRYWLTMDEPEWA